MPISSGMCPASAGLTSRSTRESRERGSSTPSGAPWDDWELEVEDYIDAGERVVVIVNQRGVQATGVPVDMRFSSLCGRFGTDRGSGWRCTRADSPRSRRAVGAACVAGERGGGAAGRSCWFRRGFGEAIPALDSTSASSRESSPRTWRGEVQGAGTRLLERPRTCADRPALHRDSHKRVRTSIPTQTAVTRRKSGRISAGAPRSRLGRQEESGAANRVDRRGSRKRLTAAGRCPAVGGADRQEGRMPHLPVNDWPGSRRIRSFPVWNAFGGQVMARPRGCAGRCREAGLR